MLYLVLVTVTSTIVATVLLKMVTPMKHLGVPPSGIFILVQYCFVHRGAGMAQW